jgi:transglutaminase-like putative cysteine protease
MARAVHGEISPDFSGYKDAHNAQTAAAIARGSAIAGSRIVALLRYVRDEILYADHPWNMQVVKDCRRTLDSRSGDCVSKSVCLATLLACLGIESRFVAQATDGANYDHVYLQALADDQWISLDPTADGRDGRPFGDAGWSQQLPAGGIETPYTIFFSDWGD